jgi:hypothetical protein
MQGPIYLELKGTQGSLFLEGHLAKRLLTLSKPLEMSLTVTPELSRYVLQDCVPFLSGMLSSNQRVKITADPKGFSLSLFPLEPKAAQFDQATIDLGHVQFANNGQLAIVTSLIAPSESDSLSVWFTPLYLSMHDGTLKLERADMLIGKEYPIAAWGKVNLLKDKVKMFIALSGLAISKAFNVQIADKGYFLQLPLTGSLSTATIDKSKATARISALVAQNHGTPQGFLIGTVLDIASGSLTEEKIPSPTTNPLPWSDLL